MQSRTLGSTGPTVGEIALGAMGFAGFYGASNDDAGIAAIRRAMDVGISMIDTAEAYGRGRSEEFVAAAVGSRRDAAVIATKASRGAPEYLRAAIDRSLSHLGMDHVDIYYLHRVDPEVPIEESVGAMAALVAAGKVRHIGLSEAGAQTIRRAHAVHPIAALQSEYSLACRDLEAEILPTIRELGIGLVAYSPLARGLLTGAITDAADLPANDWRGAVPRMQGENLIANLTLVNRVADFARRREASVAAVALAWVLAQGDDIVPLVGMSKPGNVDRNLVALDVVLSPADLAELDELMPAGSIMGDRYPPDSMPALGR